VFQQLHICLLSTGRIFGSPYGGEDKFTNALGRWLVKKNHNVTLIGIEFAGLRAKHLTNGKSGKQIETNIKQNKFRYLTYLSRLIIWFCQVIKVLLVNATRPITLIHAQDTGYTGLAAIVAGKLLGIPVIITIHGFRYKEIESEFVTHKILSKIVLPVENRLDAFVMRNASKVSVLNSQMKDYFARLGKSEIEVIPNAIRIKDFEFSSSKRDSVRVQLGIDKKANIIGFVGRFVNEKNLFTLLKSFAAVQRSHTSVKLIMVGEGPLEYRLKEFANKIEIDKSVIFCGARSDIGSVLAALDIFVLPSYAEGQSIALLEAISCGRAVICSDIAANREVLSKNQEAIFIDPNNLDSLKNAIELLITNDDIRTELSRRAKIRSCSYDEDTIFPKYLGCYEKLIEQQSKSVK
jgi:glycosyltransferase involved in cell wall biosynthesis